MDFIHGGLRGGAAADIRLIGGDDEEKTGGFEPGAGFRNTGQNLQFGQVRGRIGQAIPLHGAVDHAVAIQKDGAAQGMGDTVHSNYDTAAGAVVKTKRR